VFLCICARVGAQSGLDQIVAVESVLTMRIEEVVGSHGELRVQRLKAYAKVAKDKAKQLTTQANVSADQLKMKKSREALSQQRMPSTKTIKPHA
jgi:hypothetical protein